MQPSTVSRIAPIIAKAMNWDPVRNRDKILEEIHECESLLYSGLGDETREAFFVRGGCVPIVRYRHDCRGRCSGDYVGFSLPADVEKAEVFRLDGQRVEMHGRHAGPTGQWACRPRPCPQGMDMGQGWSLPVDPDLPSLLGFKLRSDGGTNGAAPVHVGVSYYDGNGTPQREDIEAVADTLTYTRQPVAVLAINGISIAPGRCHWLEVWQEDSHMLAEFHPSIDVPNHRRYALSGPICADRIEYESGLHVPMRRMFDTDTVCTGDPNLWRNLIQWKSLHYQTKRTPSEERAYASAGQFLAQQAAQSLRLKESDSEIVVVDPGNLHSGVIRGFRNLSRRHAPGRWRR